MSTGKTFSESWHRVAGLRIALRPTVKVRRQFFRGEKWYILEDPFNNQFFRLRPEAYDFVSRLDPSRTVESVWEECLSRRPDDAPGQEDAIQLLTQLYFANLLYFEMPADTEKLFERYKQRRQREIRSRLLTIMFSRIHLLDPDQFLRRLMPILRLVVSPIGAIVWFLVVGGALKVAIDHGDVLWDRAQAVLAPSNLFLLYLGLVLIKTVHESGHAMVCRRFGGEVHSMGVMLLVFTPLPYMDATSSWSFRSRWHRALVGAAGMIFELFLASIAMFVWANTGEGTLNSLAYNMMFIASISTVIFNANPLLRFDGYYILSDLVDIPNLSVRSTQQLQHVAEKYLFGFRDSASPALTSKDAATLTGFGILSGIYRVIVFAGVVLFVADKFFLAGLIMAATCVLSWVIVPIGRFVNYLATSPNLTRTRIRAVAISVLGLAGVITILAVYPFPHYFRAPGIMEAVEYERVAPDTGGYVNAILTESGTWVRPGTSLMQLEDPELQYDIQTAAAEREETLSYLQRAETQRIGDVDPLKKRLESIDQQIKDLEESRQSLLVKARHEGIWIAFMPNPLLCSACGKPTRGGLGGVWIPRGAIVGQIVNPSSFRFSAAVLQDEAANLFAEGIRNVEVRVRGEGGTTVRVTNYQSIPFERERLPSPAIGWRGGGDVPVSLNDGTGRTASEPFFQIYANLDPTAQVARMHGRSGQIRFTLKPQPLLQQWAESLRQLLQKRYQI